MVVDKNLCETRDIYLREIGMRDTDYKARLIRNERCNMQSIIF